MDSDSPASPFMVGMNPWHWANREGCAQDWCCRGAVDFTNLVYVAGSIAYNISTGGGGLPM